MFLCVCGCHCCFTLIFSSNHSTPLSPSPAAAADTPIEEFTPTPAFPALQYLESVDEGGVAWQAGLRTGDFLIEVRAAPFLPLGTWLGVDSVLASESNENLSTQV